jgi:hypothetical protein
MSVHRSLKRVAALAVAIALGTTISVATIGGPALADSTTPPTDTSSTSSTTSDPSQPAATPDTTAPVAAPVTAAPTDSTPPATPTDPATTTPAAPVAPTPPPAADLPVSVQSAVTAFTVNIGSQDGGSGAGKVNLPPPTLYETDVYQMPVPFDGTHATYGQTGYVGGQNKDETTQTLDVSVPTTCGTSWQVDAYAQKFSWTDNTKALDALYAAGLAGPDGAQDGSYLAGAGNNPGTFGLGHAWKFVKNPDCVLPPQPTGAATCTALYTVVLPTLVDALKYSQPDHAGEVITLDANQTYNVTVHEKAEYLSTIEYSATSIVWPFTGAAKLGGLTCNPPVACVASGNFYPDGGDLSPTATPAGDEFQGPHAQAVDTGINITGNLQGLGDIHYVVSGTPTGETARVNIQGHAPGFVTASNPSGFFTASTAQEAVSGDNDASSGLWYTSKIAYGSQGGQGNPVSYDTLVGLIGYDNTLSKLELHLQTNSTADSDSVVASLTTNSASCGGDFTYKTTITVLPTGSSNDGCGIDNDSYTYSPNDPKFDNDGYTYTITDTRGVDGLGEVTVTAVPDAGFVFPEGFNPVIVDQTYTDAPCATTVTPVGPGDATCNTDTNLPNSYADEFAALQAAQETGVVLTLEQDGKTVDVSAADGFVLSEDAPATYTLPDPLGAADCAIANATASVSTANTCGASGVAKVSLTNATLDAPLVQTVGTQVANLTTVPGSKFPASTDANVVVTNDGLNEAITYTNAAAGVGLICSGNLALTGVALVAGPIGVALLVLGIIFLFVPWVRNRFIPWTRQRRNGSAAA